MPQRLLKLDGPRRPGFVTLVETYNDGFSYCALSYCWGEGNFEMTASHNVSTRMKGFDTKVLPRTVRDAIIICQRLGIPYMWIDSLCILQDNVHEWNNEAGKMRYIYSNALFTLAAVSSHSANEGMLQPREARKFDVAEWKVLERTFGQDLETRGECPRGPLFNRGWTFQEEYLSTSILYWTMHGLAWSCQSALAYEWDNAANEDKSNDSLEVTISQLPFDWNANTFTPHHLSFAATKETPKRVLLAWAEARERYYRRQLTHPTDRLPAIAGLASLVQSRTKDEYIAGLWCKDLGKELLWYIRNPEHNTIRDPLAAPSWSWASVFNGSLEAFADARTWTKQAFELVEARIGSRIGVSGSSSTSLASSGSLTIRAQRRQIPVSQGVKLEKPSEDLNATGCSGYLKTKDGSIQVFLDESNSSISDWSQVHCLLIVEQGRHNPVGFKDLYQYPTIENMLLLVPANPSTGSKDTSFKRIGIARSTNHLSFFEPADLCLTEIT